MFAFTNNKLADAILHVFNKGVNVRLIVDDECAHQHGADVWRLCYEGITATKNRDSKEGLMHNKYCIIDK